eukprot:1193577-Prorocentrum_minimum.AAC.4
MGWGGKDENEAVQWRLSKNSAPAPLPSVAPRKNKNLVGARNDQELTGLIQNETTSRTVCVRKHY